VRRFATLIVALALGLALCAPAAAQVGPLPPADPPPPTPPSAPTSTEDEGLSTFEELLIFGAAAVLIAGIAWVIVRDAKRSAPVQKRSQPDARKPSAREREREQRQRRDKAKAARRQRKRNRRR
jgi:uncharacterized protein HemX